MRGSELNDFCHPFSMPFNTGLEYVEDALDTIIEDAQHDLLSKAHLPVVLADEDAAELAASYPGLVAALNLDDATIAGLLSGEQDVFVAACADPLSGLHGPPGKPCPARPWV